MFEEKYIKIIQDIVNKYSKDEQVMQTIEEMSELTKELVKNINRNKQNETEIILEVADVEIMLAQLILIYDIDPEKLQGAIEYKLLRQKERMKSFDKDIQCMTD